MSVDKREIGVDGLRIDVDEANALSVTISIEKIIPITPSAQNGHQEVNLRMQRILFSYCIIVLRLRTRPNK